MSKLMMMMVIKLLLREAIPAKTFAYVEAHFDLMRRVQQADPAVGFQWRLLTAVLLAQSGLFLLGSVVNDSQMTPVALNRLLLGDYLSSTAHLPRVTNALATGITVVSVLFYRVLYFDRSSSLNQTLQRVLIERDAEFFYSPTHRGVDVCRYFRRLTIRLVNTFQGFFAVVDMLLVTLQVADLLTLYAYEPCILTTPTKWWVVLVVELRLLTFFAFTLVTGRAHLLVATIYMVTVQMLKVRFGQLVCRDRFVIGGCSVVVVQQSRRSSLLEGGESCLTTQVRARYISTLAQVGQANRFCGGSFLAFMLINAPFNVVCFGALLFSGNGSAQAPRHPMATFFVTILAMQHVFGHLVIHWLFVSLNRSIERPVRLFIRVGMIKLRLLREFAFGGTGGAATQVRATLAWALFVQAFHTRKRYGFTYHRCGRITMLSYVKYLMLYSQLIMWTRSYFV